MNIHDVARHAKVSTATVSRVMSGLDVVRPHTRDRVMNSIAELGFVPNSNARSLSMGRSRMLGIIISDITNPFFPDLVQRFTELAEASGYSVLVSHTNYDAERTGRAIQRMLALKVEGVAIMTSELQEDFIRQLSDHRVPMVFLDRSEADAVENCRALTVDYETGIDQAIRHLLSLGHKRIAFLSGPQQLRSAAWRQSVFLRVLEERGILITAEAIAEGNHRVDGGYRAMQTLLAAAERPTAVLASNDLMAIGAVGAICDAGLSIPGDISVIGFDDIDISAAFNPPLTTVRLSRTEIGSQAFQTLNAAIQGLETPEHLTPVLTSLVVRKSTSAPA